MVTLAKTPKLPLWGFFAPNILGETKIIYSITANIIQCQCKSNSGNFCGMLAACQRQFRIFLRKCIESLTLQFLRPTVASDALHIMSGVYLFAAISDMRCQALTRRNGNICERIPACGSDGEWKRHCKPSRSWNNFLQGMFWLPAWDI